jgi:4-hydroxy-3-methylbut-2-enyl diphosphate reductase
MDIFLAQPRGFCAGVTRAIDVVTLALERFGAPVYVFHEIVHNQHVVSDLRTRGAIFVNSIEDVPLGSVTIFSAHGVSRAVVDAAGRRQLDAIDATCPLVTKVHMQAQRFVAKGLHLVMVGHAGHEEVEGTIGSVDGPVHLVATLEDVDRLPWDSEAGVAYVTQTTLSLDDTRELLSALKRRYPRIVGPEVNDICYATQNRQNAVRSLATRVDLMLVVGAHNSSNSNRLWEVAQRVGCRAYLVQDASELDTAWWSQGVERIGISSGASTPEVLVQAVVDRIRSTTNATVREVEGLKEHVIFRLPRSLEGLAA